MSVSRDSAIKKAFENVSDQRYSLLNPQGYCLTTEKFSINEKLFDFVLVTREVTTLTRKIPGDWGEQWADFPTRKLPSHEDVELLISGIRQLYQEITPSDIQKINEQIRLQDETEYLAQVEDFYNKNSPKKKVNNPGFFYIGRSNSLYKIGISKNMKSREKSYKTENPFGFDIVFQCSVTRQNKCERAVAEAIGKSPKLRKEWFELNEAELQKAIQAAKKYANS